MTKLITFILALIGVYALCSLIIWNINIEFLVDESRVLGFNNIK
jgi:hypothetical protein